MKSNKSHFGKQHPGEEYNEQARATTSYGQILRSSALVGGSSLIAVALRIVRVKVFALLLGPAGVGLLGIYTSITQLTQTLVSIGIETSGVRQIAEANRNGDERSIAAAAIVLRRLGFLLGLLGAGLLFFLSAPIARISFGNQEHSSAIEVLSLVVGLGIVSVSQRALIQGMRRITDLALVTVLGAFFATMLGIGCIYLLGEQGVVPYLLAEAASLMLATWWFARRVCVRRVVMSWKDAWSQAGPLLRLGVVFMVSVLMSAGIVYFTRVYIARQLGMDDAGFYQASSTLSTLYAAFILQAMGADFYPRLTAASSNAHANQLVNEQVEVGLLLAAPGILSTLAFAPLVIYLFFSTDFSDAIGVLEWQILGVLLQVAAWPMGYILPAQGRTQLFFWTELMAHGLHLFLIVVCVTVWSLPGTGIAFLGMYVFYWCFMLFLIRTITGFRLTSTNKKLIFLISLAAVVVFLSRRLLLPEAATVVGGLVTATITFYSWNAIRSLTSFPRMAGLWGKLRRS